MVRGGRNTEALPVMTCRTIMSGRRYLASAVILCFCLFIFMIYGNHHDGLFNSHVLSMMRNRQPTHPQKIFETDIRKKTLDCDPHSLETSNCTRDGTSSYDNGSSNDRLKVPNRLGNARNFSYTGIYDTHREDTEPIILFAYMKGGSKLFGRLVTRLVPDANYWYEPVYDAYNSMVPGHKALLPMNIFTDAEMNSLRNITDYEKAFVMGHLSQLLLCQFEKLPPEALSFWSIEKSSTRKFEKCMWKHTEYNIVNKMCKKPLRNECSRQVISAIHAGCHHYMEDIHTTDGVPGNMTSSPLLQNYKQCMKPVHEGVANCISQLQCSSKSVMKILRLYMSYMNEFVEKFPRSKVIHLLRDPRGIIASRKYVGWGLLTGDIGREAKLLCAKMMSDLQAFHKLHTAHPSVFFQVRYEDLVSHANDTAQRIMHHLGIDFTHVSSIDFGNSMETQNVDHWKDRLSVSEIGSINNQCEDLLNLLGYSGS